MSRGQNSRLLLEIEIDLAGEARLLDTDDRVSVKPVGGVTTIFLEDSPTFSGHDIFYTFREAIRDAAPLNANAYNVQHDHPNPDKRLERGSPYYRDGDNLYIPVQFYKIDGSSMEQVLKRSFAGIK
jgi:hypothetical protein